MVWLFLFCSDDLLNYELGELDDNVLAADEDELLQSDDGKQSEEWSNITKFMFKSVFIESSPTKLSQQEEALLLDDEELLNCPQSDANISLCPEEKEEVPPPDSIHISEFRDDFVTTTTPEPTTTNIISNEAEATSTENEFTYASSRTPLKRGSDSKQRDSEDSTSAAFESKKLRVDAPEFVPSHTGDSELHIRDNDKNEENSDTVVESMSYVSTSSSTIEGHPGDEIVSSQKNILDTTDTSIGLSLTADDDLEHEIKDDAAEQLPTCSSQTTGEHYAEEAADTASSSGMEETEFDFSTSNTHRKPALLALPEFETEDSDEGNERLNPKHHVERDSADGKYCWLN